MARKKVAEGEELTFEQVNERYRGEWVLLQVTKLKQFGRISHGRVLEHAQDRRTVAKRLDVHLRREPGADLEILYGGPARLQGDELRRVMAEAADGYDPSGPNVLGVAGYALDLEEKRGRSNALGGSRRRTT